MMRLIDDLIWVVVVNSVTDSRCLTIRAGLTFGFSGPALTLSFSGQS